MDGKDLGMSTMTLMATIARMARMTMIIIVKVCGAAK